MKRKQFTEEQIIGILKGAEPWVPILTRLAAAEPPPSR